MHKIKLVILCMFIMTASMTACSSEKKNITELQKESTEKSEGTIEQTNTATLNVSTETIPHTEEVTTDTVSERDYSADGISWKEAETLITEVLGTEDKRIDIVIHSVILILVKWMIQSIMFFSGAGW